LLDDVLEKKFKEVIKDIIYVRPENYLPFSGFQRKEMSENEKMKIHDVPGFCAVWVVWYLDHRLSYPDISRNKLVLKLMKLIRDDDVSFKNEIRNYSQKVTSVRKKILSSASLDINEWTYGYLDQDKFFTVLGTISSELNIN